MIAQSLYGRAYAVHKLIRFSLIFAGSAAALRIFGFLLSMWVARTLVPEQYGIWGLAYAFQTGIVTFGMVGIQEAIVGLLRQHPTKPERQRLYQAAIGAMISTLSVTLVVAFSGVLLILVPRNMGVIGYVGIVVSGAVLAVSTLQAQMARLEEDHLSSLNFSFTIPLAGLVGSAFAFSIEASVEAFFVGSALAMLAGTTLLRRHLIGFAKSSNQVIDTRNQVLQRLMPFILVAFFGWISGYGSSFFVDRLFNAVEVGKLTLVLTFGSVIQLMTTALNQVWTPRFLSLLHSQQPLDAIERHNHYFYNAQGWGLGALAAICVASVPHLLHYVGGNLTSYASMQTELLLIFSGYIVLVPWTHCQNYLLAYDKGTTLMNVVVVTSIVGVMVWLILMWFLGPIGIYLGFFTQMLVRTLGITLSVRRQWRVHPSWSGTFGGILLACTGLLL